jgi:outer membrane cobalamin receptor
MFYYPDENLTYGMAEDALYYLGYNNNPERLQIIIQQIYKYAIQQISIPGVEIIACPMFEILDCKSTEDYVEPSNLGGRKIAKCLVELIKKID